MGLTFVAAGVSVPDALSSLAVVKEGTYLSIGMEASEAVIPFLHWRVLHEG
jgi:hypothetical protein